MTKSSLFTLLAVAALSAGCEYRSVVYTVPNGVASDGAVWPAPSTTESSQAVDSAPGYTSDPTSDPNSAIIINSINANPTNLASRNDHITFTLNAFNNDHLPMQYTWSATKGTLSATRGEMVSWSPLKSDGSIEQGVATIQVLATDADGATKQAAVNLLINSDGSTSHTDSTTTVTTTTTTK